MELKNLEEIVSSDAALKDLYIEYLRHKLEYDIIQMKYNIAALKEGMVNKDTKKKEIPAEKF